MTGFWTLQALNTLQHAALLLLISSGLSVSFGLMGFVNLAHGALYMLGAYLGITIAAHAGFWVALLAAPPAVAATVKVSASVRTTAVPVTGPASENGTAASAATGVGAASALYADAAESPTTDESGTV